MKTNAGFSNWLLVVLMGVIAMGAFLVLLLYQNIAARKVEAQQHVFKVVETTEATIDPIIWGKNYPRQYDSYRRTVDIERTKHGGSEAFQKLDVDPRWRTLFAGYAFGVDYREERGHAYMLSDQDETERVKNFKQPGSCLHCHAAVIPAYIEAGAKKTGVKKAIDALTPSERETLIQKGFEEICPMPYADARKLVQHPVTCTDCHEASTMNLRVSRPGFVNGIRALAESKEPTPHLQSIERWRKGDRKQPYNPNVEATRQEMRSLVCGQCHVEYYFKGQNKLVTYPWHNGLKVEQIEAYYDEVKHVDWKHRDSGADVLKAQHPEFELWSQGIHARSGVSCADCHMPYQREGAIKVSSHHVRSPMLNVAQACQSCHRYPEAEIKARVEAIQDRTAALMIRAEEATVQLIQAIKAKAGGNASVDNPAIAKARDLHRKAQWRLDFIAAENSTGFHAPQESARILAEAIDFARQGIAELK